MRRSRPATVDPKVSFVTLGCPKNLVDSEVLLGNLMTDGFLLCADPKDADVVVVNTCAFIDDSKAESKRVIREALALKERGQVKGVVVAGCLAQRYGDALLAEMPGIDGLLGISDQAKVAEVCRRVAGPSHVHPVNEVGSNERACNEDVSRLRLTPTHYAYVRISEGCDNPCTFCVIPTIRGGFRSKPLPVILQEVKELVADGASEIVLIAQDTTDYGRDLGGHVRLPHVLEAVAAVAGVRWLRVMYAYPANTTRELIQALASIPQVVKYLDIPVQHASDAMLRRMARRITRERQLELFRELRAAIPGLFLRTSIIVGHPGETEADVEDLLRFLDEVRFERLGTFKYSREESTPAARMPDQVPADVAQARYDAVMSLQQRIAFDRHKGLVGSTLPVIVDRAAENRKAQWIGRTYGDAPDIDGVITLSGRGLRVGGIYEARVTASNGYDLHGKVEKAGVSGAGGNGR
ncbi:MAG: 30S ribosomal protein S12 methylthiotransferase RimO [Planctomycetes bacterium]|nr:30S ribosomal protein S12 methylthiotransferase RimO [Planctomycetota bacterium]